MDQEERLTITFCTRRMLLRVSSEFLITRMQRYKSEQSRKRMGLKQFLQENGKLHASFKLPPHAGASNNTVYVSADYEGETTFNNTKFKVNLLEDFNGDGKVF